MLYYMYLKHSIPTIRSTIKKICLNRYPLLSIHIQKNHLEVPMIQNYWQKVLIILHSIFVE